MKKTFKAFQAKRWQMKRLSEGLITEAVTIFSLLQEEEEEQSKTLSISDCGATVASLPVMYGRHCQPVRRTRSVYMYSSLVHIDVVYNIPSTLHYMIKCWHGCNIPWLLVAREYVAKDIHQTIARHNVSKQYYIVS